MSDKKNDAFGPHGLMCNGEVWVYDYRGTHIFKDTHVPNSGARYWLAQDIAATMVDEAGELINWQILEEKGLATVNIKVDLTTEGERIAAMLKKERKTKPPTPHTSPHPPE